MQWLALKEATNGSDKDKMRRISFSTFHSIMLHLRKPVKDISTMLPLLNEAINSPSVVYHCLNVISKLTAKLNPSQVPVTTADQPVFALAKQVQWNYPEKFQNCMDHCILKWLS